MLCFDWIPGHHGWHQTRVFDDAGAQGPASDVKTAAALTVRTLQRTVPCAVPGIMFLSGKNGGDILSVMQMLCRMQQESSIRCEACPGVRLLLHWMNFMYLALVISTSTC